MKPCWPSFLTATTPASCNSDWAQSDSHAEKLILNLRGICWFSGLRKKCCTAPSRCAATSTCSLGHTPDNAHADMLRTVLPQASRVVMLTCARRRIALGIFASGMKCTCIDWRVVRCAIAALRKSFRHIGDRIQLVCVQTPAGDLDAQHVHAFLALAIHALLQPHGGKAIGIDTALDESLDRLFETVYLFQIGKSCVLILIAFLLTKLIQNHPSLYRTIRVPMISSMVASTGRNTASGTLALRWLPI